jgi:hypothetical protein
MPDTVHPTGANEGTDHAVAYELVLTDELRSLTAHLANLDLDPATLELLMAVLTIDVTEVEAAPS